MLSLHVILRRLAIVCGGMSMATSAAVAADLSAIPARKLNQVVEETEDNDDWAPEDRVRLLGMLGCDSRPAVREQVATSLAIRPVTWSPPLEPILTPLLTQLCADPAPNVRAAAHDAFLHELLTMDGFDRSCVVVDWATSPDPRQRLIMAQVLAEPIGAVGIEGALEKLATDDVPAIREAAQASLHALQNTRTARTQSRRSLAGDQSART